MLETVNKHIHRKLGAASNIFIPIVSEIVSIYSWTDSYNRGRMYGWDYEVIQKFQSENIRISMELIHEDYKAFENTAESIRNLMNQQVQMPHGPFIGCFACRKRCLLRFDLLPLVNDPAVIQEWQLSIQNGISISEACVQWMDATKQALRTYLDDDELPDSPDLLICSSAQVLSQIGLSSASQRRMINNLCELL